jgi:hypothetical protein
VWRRSQWPSGLNHEPSSSAQILGLWVRIPLKAWMSVWVYSVLVAALRRAHPPSKESYRLCIELRNWKSGQGPNDSGAIERKKNYNFVGSLHKVNKMDSLFWKEIYPSLHGFYLSRYATSFCVNWWKVWNISFIWPTTTSSLREFEIKNVIKFLKTTKI